MSGSSVSNVDVREFSGPARVQARSAAVVGRGLEAAVPNDATVEEKAALARAVAAGDEVQDSLRDREQASPSRIKVPYTALAVMWSILFDALVAISRIPAEVSPRGPRALALVREVLPEGTTFMQLEAGQAWSASVRRLKVIDERGLAPAIGELVGSDVIDGVRTATATLREALGAGPTPIDIASSTAVAEKIANFSRLVGIYCRILAAKFDESDAASVERFRKAIAPLIEYRASRRGQDDDDDVAAPPVVGNPAIAPGLPGSSPFITGPAR